jgi:hypothetical protein
MHAGWCLRAGNSALFSPARLAYKRGRNARVRRAQGTMRTA